MEDRPRDCYRVYQHVEVPGIELSIGPAALLRLSGGLVISLTQSDIRAWCVRPVLHVWKRLLKEVQTARVEFGQHSLTESRVGDELAEILIRPLREGASRFQICPQVPPEIWSTCLNLLEMTATGVWKTGVDEDVACHRVWAEGANGRQEGTPTAMTNQDETSVRRLLLQPSRDRCCVPDPVGHLATVVVCEPREDSGDTTLPQLARDWSPGHGAD